MNAILHPRSPAPTNRATHKSRKAKRGNAWITTDGVADHGYPRTALLRTVLAHCRCRRRARCRTAADVVAAFADAPRRGPRGDARLAAGQAEVSVRRVAPPGFCNRDMRGRQLERGWKCRYAPPANRGGAS